MKNKILFTILIISIGLNIGFIYFYSNKSNLKNNNEKLKNFNYKNSYLSKNLNLNNQQIIKFNKDFDKISNEILPIKEKIMNYKFEIIKKLKKDKLTENNINNLANTISKMRAEIEKKFIKHMFKVRKNLNEQQKNKFDKMFQKCFCHTFSEINKRR